MAVNYQPWLGPIADPDYGLTSWGFVEDFIGLDISATEHAARWYDVSSTGTATSPADEPFGAVAILNGAATGDDAGIQLSGEPIAFDHGKDMIFGCRLKTSSVTGGNLFVGLHEETDGTGFDVGSGASIVTNHIGFSTRGAASIFFDTADGSSQSRFDTTDDLVADTYVLLVAKYTAADGKWRFYVDGTLRGSHSIADDKLPADLTQMTFGIHYEFQSAAATLEVDYVYVAGER
jgi:hypothetical protein